MLIASHFSLVVALLFLLEFSLKFLVLSSKFFNGDFTNPTLFLVGRKVVLFSIFLDPAADRVLVNP